MAYESLLGLRKDTRHKIFISYYHKDDEYYRYQFEQSFGHLFISKSVQPGAINSDVSADYIKRLIQMGYITDASVVVILVGPKTYCRKHVDWEIGSSIRHTEYNPRSGLLGIVLPTYPTFKENTYNPHTIPPRLNDNIECKFAKIYAWNTNPLTIQDWIHEAFERRNIIPPDNSYPSFANNRAGDHWQ